MPSLPTSLIIVGLVAAWLIVLVPMMSRSRESVPEDVDEGANLRVLDHATAPRRRRAIFSRSAILHRTRADFADEAGDDVDRLDGDQDNEDLGDHQADAEYLDSAEDDAEGRDNDDASGSETTRAATAVATPGVSAQAEAEDVVDDFTMPLFEVDSPAGGTTRDGAAAVAEEHVEEHVEIGAAESGLRSDEVSAEIFVHRDEAADSDDNPQATEPREPSVRSTARKHLTAIRSSARRTRQAAAEAPRDARTRWLAAPSEPINLDEDYQDEPAQAFSGAEAAQADEPSYPSRERDEDAVTPGSATDLAEERDRYRPVPQRAGRGGYDPEMAERARAYRFQQRRRVALSLLVIAAVGAAVGWFGHTWGYVTAISGGVLLALYLAYLRRQVQIEQELRERRAARLHRARQIRPGYRPSVAEQVYAHRTGGIPRPGAVGDYQVKSHARQMVPPQYPAYGTPVDLEDSDPIFDELDYYRPAHYRRRAG